MTQHSARPEGSRTVFLVGGWRRWLLPGLFGTFMLGGLLLLTLSDTPDERGAGGVLTLMMALFTALGEAMVRYTRLEVSADGLRLRQVGYRVHAPWSNIRGFYRTAMRQGFILADPLTGKGADRLAFAAGVRIQGAPMYDDTQQALMEQRRFIPIEAFATHLKSGRLVDAVARFAPALRDPMTLGDGIRMLPGFDADGNAMDPAQSAAAAAGFVLPAARPPRAPIRWGMLAGIVALIGGAIWLAVADPPWAGRLLAGVAAIGTFALSFASVLSARNAARSRRWFWLALFIAQAVIMLLLALAALGNLL